MKRSPWLNFRKRWSNKFNREKFKKVSIFDWIIMTNVTVWAGVSFMGQDLSGANDKEQAEKDKAAISVRLDTLEKQADRISSLSSEIERVNAAKNISHEDKVEAITGLNKEKMDLLTQQGVQGQSIGHQILVTPSLGEKDAYKLMAKTHDLGGLSSEFNIADVTRSMAFLNECRGVAKNPQDLQDLTSCMIEYQKADDQKSASFRSAAWLISYASFGGLALLSFAGSALRKGVKKEEDDIERKEFNNKLDHLRGKLDLPSGKK